MCGIVLLFPSYQEEVVFVQEVTSLPQVDM